MCQIELSQFRLHRGDITTLAVEALPAKCSLALIDADLTEPTYVALKFLRPRMATGGVILIDDCPPISSWKARDGYIRFCNE
ncbi:class I SAM-dependent methyltransferase [Aromatoleum buckelii]|uniref:Uncharacterized protein n=1 Tax=Aromatoleum buckelii TaxID=200254 RepID=A0ABX1N530_9RHOO